MKLGGNICCGRRGNAKPIPLQDILYLFFTDFAQANKVKLTSIPFILHIRLTYSFAQTLLPHELHVSKLLQYLSIHSHLDVFPSTTVRIQHHKDEFSPKVQERLSQASLA